MHSLSGLSSRGIYSSEPPPARSSLANHPTLLVSWWATVFSCTVIAVRVFGRYVRTERLFPEDKVMLLSVLPLIARMIFVHFVLILGTNNTQTAGLTLADIDHREVGSKLVLCARIFYAMFIWTAKLTVALFLKRVAGMIWRRSVTIFLRVIYWFLGITLLAVVIATLGECHPFDHYWQVVPDPGPHCRLGYANLLTMGTCDVITDLLLVTFPIPIIIATQMPLKRKVSLVSLFALSLILVAITCYRVPSVILHDGSQQYRSLMASFEILAATSVSNALVIGSFIRDKGVKKLKFKKAIGAASLSESLEQRKLSRKLTYHQWGSEENLAAEMGIRLHPSSIDEQNKKGLELTYYRPYGARTGTLDPDWTFGKGNPEDDGNSASDSLDVRICPREYIETNVSRHEKNSGNVVISNTEVPSPANAASQKSQTGILKTVHVEIHSDISAPPALNPGPFFDVAGALGNETRDPSNSNAQRAHMNSTNPFNGAIQPHGSGSRALLQDVGGLLSDLHDDSTPTIAPGGSSPQPQPPGSGSQHATHGGIDAQRQPAAPPSYTPQSGVSGHVDQGDQI